MNFKKDKLSVEISTDRGSMGLNAAKDVLAMIKKLLSEKSEIFMLFAAAPSQSEFLAALVADKSVEWNRINAFHLDEYIGLEKNAPQRFVQFLEDHIIGKVPFKSVNYIDGSSPGTAQECSRYAQLLSKQPINIACIGIGENGHIAFNDPHVADFKDKAMIKVVELDLDCRTQQVNDKCFDKIDQVPKQAYTLTIPALMSVEHVFCIVPGSTKAKAVYNTINGAIDESCPASILRTKSGAILYLDKDSAALLEL